jgi:hypothetical protein
MAAIPFAGPPTNSSPFSVVGGSFNAFSIKFDRAGQKSIRNTERRASSGPKAMAPAPSQASIVSVHAVRAAPNVSAPGALQSDSMRCDNCGAACANAPARGTK